MNSAAVEDGQQCLSQTSSSRCVTGTVNTTHNFEVTNYSLLNDMAIGKFVRSSPFSAGGYDWRLHLYPNSHKTEKQGAYMSMYLYFLGGTGAASAILTLILLGNNDQVQKERTNARTFETVGEDWGWHEFIEKSKLQELLRLNGGRLKIRCVLTMRGAPEADAAAAVVVPQPKLQQDLTDMLENGQGVDVKFSVGDQVFHAHRCILAARCMVFKAELFGAMKEKDQQCIKVDDMEPTIFRALLHFVYTDSLTDDDCDSDCAKSLPDDFDIDSSADKNAAMQHLLVAADRYGLDRLRLLCEAKLCRDVDVQTVATTLALAEQHQCTQLKAACLGFIASRDVLGAVMETDGFKHLIASCPSIMQEILEKIAAVWSSRAGSVVSSEQQ